MKYLVMCEGTNEKEIMRILLEHKKLTIKEDQLLGLNVFHARQIDKSPQVQLELNMYPNEVNVMRIGDKQNEKLRIPKQYKDKIKSITKYCTKPELEIILIIAENKYKEYEKVKSKVKPKQFAKENIHLGKKVYDNTSEFYREYFDGRVELLCKSIRDYRKLNGAHLKEEHYLEELLESRG